MFDSCFQKNRTTGIDADTVKARFEKEYAKNAEAGLSYEDSVNAAVKAINLESLQSLKNDVYRKVKNAAAFTRGQAETSTPLPGTGILKQEPTRNGTLQRLMVAFTDLQGNVESVSQRQKGIMGTYSPRMNDILRILGTKNWGFAEHRENYVMFEKALRGEHVDSPEIAKAAEQWKLLNDEILDRSNAAGSVIGKREDWYRPQSWSRDLALSYGTGKGQAKYDSAHKNLSDHWFNNRDIEAYKRDGIVGDEAIRRHIDEAAHSVLSDGLNKTETDTPNVRTPVSSRMAQERQIHIATAEGAAELNRLFGAKSLPELMQDHIQSMSKNIALMERFGPDAQTTIQKLINHNIEQAPEGPAKEHEAKAGKDAQNYADYYGHFNSDIHYTASGRFIAGLKNLELLKLGKAAIYSLTTDQSTARVAQAAFGASGWEYTLHQLRGSILSLKKGEQDFLLNQAGLAAHVMNQSIFRSWNEVAAHGWTKAVSGVFMKATHLRQIGEWNKEADRATLLSAIGKKVQNYGSLKEIKGLDGKILRSHGFTDGDWQVMKLATPEQWGPSDHVLTAKAISEIPNEKIQALGLKDAATVKRNLGEKLIGFAHEFDDTVIVEPGDKQRADVLSHKGRGSFKGEIAHSMMQFKTFPLAFAARHARLTQGAGPIAGTAYMASLLAANTVMGMVAGSIQDLLAGRNVRDWAEMGEVSGVPVPKHLGEAFSKGGGLGMMTDMIGSLSDQNAIQSTLKFVAGPVVGEGIQALATAFKPFAKLNDPKYDAKDFIGDAARQGSSFVPGSTLPFVSLIFQRELLNQLQEWSNPGYNSRSIQRSQKQYGSSYWWNPGETAPESLPEVTH